MENTAAHFFGRKPELPNDKSELFEKLKWVLPGFSLCVPEGKEENHEQIVNEMQGWIATLLYADMTKMKLSPPLIHGRQTSEVKTIASMNS